MYSQDLSVNDSSSTQVRQLVYNSRTSWTEMVPEADPVVTRWGVFSSVDSYHKFEGTSTPPTMRLTAIPLWIPSKRVR